MIRSADRQLGADDRSVGGVALQLKLSSEGLDAVGEPSQAGAVAQVCAAASVVSDLDDDRVGRRRELHEGFRGAGVFRRVREAFGDDVVDGCLDRLGKAGRCSTGDLDRKRGAVRERLQCGDEPAVGEDRRVKATSELLELLRARVSGPRQRPRAVPLPRRVLAQALLGHPQMKREGDETLLGAVVKVALESPALRDTRLDDPRARGRQLIVGLGALERERDELREVGEALLCVRREVVGCSPRRRTAHPRGARPR